MNTSPTFSVPAGEIQHRQARIQEAMQRAGIDAVFIMQRVDLFYFTGTAQNGFLFMPAEGEPLLLIRKYMPRARAESSVKNMIEIQSVKEIPGLVMDCYGKLPKSIGFELDVLPVNTFHFYRALFPGSECPDISGIILKVRAVKSDWEIRQLENTAGLSSRIFNYMQEVIRPGISEIEFSGMFEAFARKLGYGFQLRVRGFQTEVYTWHVLSGESGGMVGILDAPASGEGTSAAFPCGAGTRLLAPHEPIMVDLSIVMNGYHMDETRILSLGALPERAADACQAAIDIQNVVLEKAAPGLPASELFALSNQVAQSLGYENAYLGPPGYKVAFIGHGIGLELIEPPFIARNRKDLLQPGMVFALEPKMVFDNEFSAGIESVFRVTDTGAELISKVPSQVFICQM